MNTERLIREVEKRLGGVRDTDRAEILDALREEIARERRWLDPSPTIEGERERRRALLGRNPPLRRGRADRPRLPGAPSGRPVQRRGPAPGEGHRVLGSGGHPQGAPARAGAPLLRADGQGGGGGPGGLRGP